MFDPTNNIKTNLTLKIKKPPHRYRLSVIKSNKKEHKGLIFIKLLN
jgi:hypothetical protein